MLIQQKNLFVTVTNGNAVKVVKLFLQQLSQT